MVDEALLLEVIVPFNVAELVASDEADWTVIVGGVMGRAAVVNV